MAHSWVSGVDSPDRAIEDWKTCSNQAQARGGEGFDRILLGTHAKTDSPVFLISYTRAKVRALEAVRCSLSMIDRLTEQGMYFESYENGIGSRETLKAFELFMLWQLTSLRPDKWYKIETSESLCIFDIGCFNGDIMIKVGSDEEQLLREEGYPLP